MFFIPAVSDFVAIHASFLATIRYLALRKFSLRVSEDGVEGCYIH